MSRPIHHSHPIPPPNCSKIIELLKQTTISQNIPNQSTHRRSPEHSNPVVLTNVPHTLQPTSMAACIVQLSRHYCPGAKKEACSQFVNLAAVIVRHVSGSRSSPAHKRPATHSHFFTSALSQWPSVISKQYKSNWSEFTSCDWNLVRDQFRSSAAKDGIGSVAGAWRVRVAPGGRYCVLL